MIERLGYLLQGLTGLAIIFGSCFAAVMVVYGMPDAPATYLAAKVGLQALNACGLLLGIILAFVGIGRALDL